MPSRRRFLAAVAGTGATVGLAGCGDLLSETASPDDPPTPAESDTNPDPEDHIFGATGEWSSYGCNAANNRSVDDGRAPVDGVTERWRMPVGDFDRFEPAVAGDRLYLVRGGEELVAYDTEDGSELWRKPGRSRPLVRDDTVYVGDFGALYAYRVSDGTERWSVEFEIPGSVGAPATHGGETLFVPAGESVHAVEASTGRREWSRQLFGEVMGPAASYMGYAMVFATEAAKVFALAHDGTGIGQWDLPAQPRRPPVSDSDGFFVPCLDGETYAMVMESTPRYDVDWSVETGWSDGLAVERNLYAAGSRGLVAADPESGERLWQHDIGDWTHTGAALGRDTLFCGGDALYAFDPTPSVGSGPALRFEHAFEGRVNAPVLDDGSLYVIAETGEMDWHLFAFD